jgi:CRP-like cAMP-binding protein
VNADHLDKFKDVPLFRGVSENDLTKIINTAHESSLEAGAFFFHQGDPANRLFLLTHGRVKLGQLSPDGQQVLIKIISPYAMFGVIAIVQGSEYPLFAEAAELSRAHYWIEEDFTGLISSFPGLALNAMQMMADHVKDTQDRFRQLATERVERRIARTLIRLANQSGRKVDKGVLIDLPLTRQDLAEMSGTTLFTVSRTLSQWENEGIVISGRGKVIIRFPHGLVRIAEDLAPLNPLMPADPDL